MKFEIKHRFSGEILFSCEAESLGIAVKLALKARADLSYANLRSTNLRYADLSCTNLRSANLRYANLRSADLRYVDLRSTYLRYADLRCTNLRGADLRYADLSYANLRGADLDFSSWPLHCGSFNAKADNRLVWQLICHLTRLDISGCSEEAQAAIGKIHEYANKFCEYRSDVDPI